MDPLLEYACRRVTELETLLLVDVQDTVWPAEVGMVYSQIENAGDLPAHHQRRLKHHINRMWLELKPAPLIVAGSSYNAGIMVKHTRYVIEGNMLETLQERPVQ
ncbi:hypothetical protein ABKV66_16020 [Enterobacter hormaechei]|uniref:hypothetical protein n=1 Tax=Enterobacter hormaechei TaxID=158836 RepID=UPI000B6A6F58|nr:hypothetical protein [Enterobacter hormaechei]MCM6973220.1 hypothetical protein [Enterobacter hormaechei]MCR4244852.1 hypothetical protein [Enterobacter hormaechei]OUK76279.1 hypothetical protein BZY51_18735 [Enterobacter hormaechei]